MVTVLVSLIKREKNLRPRCWFDTLLGKNQVGEGQCKGEEIVKKSHVCCVFVELPWLYTLELKSEFYFWPHDRKIV